MDSGRILQALERERQLLEDFICLSEQQLLFLKDENIDAVDSLLHRRADLMMELTAIEATLGTWITQIRTDPTITTDMLHQLQAVNDEIVSMANHIVEIDELTHTSLDLIGLKSAQRAQAPEPGARTLQVYVKGYGPIGRR